MGSRQKLDIKAGPIATAKADAKVDCLAPQVDKALFGMERNRHFRVA